MYQAVEMLKKINTGHACYLPTAYPLGPLGSHISCNSRQTMLWKRYNSGCLGRYHRRDALMLGSK